MRIYHSVAQAKRNAPDGKQLIMVNQTIRELKIFKGNIVETTGHDKASHVYILDLGCGVMHLYDGYAKEIQR